MCSCGSPLCFFVHIDGLNKAIATITQTKMSAHKKLKVSCKIWIEYNGKPVVGKGGAKILEEIEKQKSISKAAKKLGMSYRYVWSYIRKIEKTMGEPIIETHRGGRSGGGGAKLTRLGKSLLDKYKRVEGYFGEVLSETNVDRQPS